MRRGIVLFVAGVVLSTVGVQAVADEVRQYTGTDGRPYLETRRVVQRPVSETQIVERQVPVLREELRTNYVDSYRTYHTPVTEYRWETHLRNRWNPFAAPYLEPRLVPRTYWEPHTEVVQVPVTRRELVSATRVERVPVTTRRFVAEEQISRVAISDAPGDPFASGTAVARRETIGGTQLQSDPPRQSTAPIAIPQQ